MRFLAFIFLMIICFLCKLRGMNLKAYVGEVPQDIPERADKDLLLLFSDMLPSFKLAEILLHIELQNERRFWWGRVGHEVGLSFRLSQIVRRCRHETADSLATPGRKNSCRDISEYDGAVLDLMLRIETQCSRFVQMFSAPGLSLAVNLAPA